MGTDRGFSVVFLGVGGNRITSGKSTYIVVVFFSFGGGNGNGGDGGIIGIIIF